MKKDSDELTSNERAWLRFLRDVSKDSDPGPTLRCVQLLRRLCEPRRRLINEDKVKYDVVTDYASLMAVVKEVA